MPFIKTDPNIVIPSLVVEDTRVPDVDATLGESFKRAFRYENIVGATITNKTRGNWIRDPEFDFNQAYEELPLEYRLSEDIALRFANAENNDHFSAIREQVDQELSDKEYLAQAGWRGVVATLAAGIFDPINLLPVGGTAYKVSTSGAKTYNVLRAGAQTAMAGAVSMSLQEAALHTQQETRTLGESAANISAGTVLSGLLGAGSYALFKKAPDYDGFAKKFDEEMGYSVPPDITPPDSSVGSKLVIKKSREELLEDNSLVYDKVFKPIKFQDPGLRLAYSESVNARIALQELADFAPKFKKNLRGESVGNSVEIQTRQDADYFGKKVMKKNKAYLSYKKRVGKSPDRLNVSDFNEEITKTLRRNSVSDIPEINTIASEFRELYTRFGDDGLRTGVFKDKEAILSKRDTYVNQIVDKAKLAADPDGFKAIIKDYFKQEYQVSTNKTKTRILEDAVETLDDDYFDRLAREVYQNYMGARSSDLQDGIGPSTVPKFAKSRKIDMDFNTSLGQRFEKYLENDIEVLGKNYTAYMSARTRLADRFGIDFIDDDLMSKKSKVVSDITDEFDDLLAKVKNNPKEYKRLSVEREKTINDLLAIRDRVLGTYGYSMNPDSWAYRSQKQIKQFNVVTMLGDVTASSMPDVGKVIMEAGLSRFLTKGLKPLVKSLYSKEFREYLATNFTEASRLSSGLETYLSGTVSSINDLMDAYGKHTKLERVADVVSQKAITMTGIRHWNAALKQIAGMVINDNMIDSMKALATGKASKKQISNLARAGISVDDAKLIYKQIKANGEIIDGLTMPNLAKWDNPQLAELYMGAIKKDTDRVIVTPGAATTPLFMSKNGFTLFTQFQSFAFSSMQKTLIPMVQDFDAKTTQGLTVMVGLGSLVAAYKRAARGEEMPDTKTLIQEGIDRSGTLAWIMDYNNRLEKLSQGQLGVSRILGTNATNKYYNYNSAALLGPTSGQADNAIGIASDILSGRADQGTVHRARRLLPLQTMIGIRQILDLIEKEFNSNLGIPKNK